MGFSKTAITLLKNRQKAVKLTNTISEWEILNHGVPQGTNFEKYCKNTRKLLDDVDAYMKKNRLTSNSDNFEL